MAATASTTAAFAGFSALAPELRNQIWRDALPDEGGSVLVPYRMGCWQPRDSEEGLLVEFRHDRLEAVRCEFSMAFVNREAHGVARAWFRQQKRFTLRLRQSRAPVLVRPLDPATDALYVSPHQWGEVASGRVDRCMEEDLLGQLVDVAWDVPRVALPEAFLLGSIAEVPMWGADMVGLRELLVVVAMSPGLPPVYADEDEDAGPVRRPWEFVDTGGDVFVWDAHGRRFVLDGRREPVGDGVVARLVDGSDEVSRAFAKENVLNFTIRPVWAAPR